MKKAKLIASLSLLPTLAIAPAFLSSCATSHGSYTVMNIPNLCVLKAPAEKETEVIVAENVYIYGPNRDIVPIVSSECKATVGGTNANFIDASSIKFHQNANGSVDILATVNSNWKGEETTPSPSLYFDVEFMLNTNTPINWRINITVIHDYCIKPIGEAILYTPGTKWSKKCYLTDGELETKQITADSWEVTTQDKFASYIHFDSAPNNDVLIIESNAPLTREEYTKITITAKKGDYVITESVIIMAE